MSPVAVFFLALFSFSACLFLPWFWLREYYSRGDCFLLCFGSVALLLLVFAVGGVILTLINSLYYSFIHAL